MKKIVIITIIFLFANWSCKFNVVVTNREEDIEQAKAFLFSFYKNVINHNYTAIDSMVSDSVKPLISHNGMSEIVVFINNKLGNCLSFKIIKYNVNHSVGTTNAILYSFIMQVKYEKGMDNEVILLEKRNNGLVKIQSYHAFSDLLLK